MMRQPACAPPPSATPPAFFRPGQPIELIDAGLELVRPGEAREQAPPVAGLARMPSKVREYARNARDAAAQAARATDPEVRRLLEHMAETWSRLAEAAAEHARQRRVAETLPPAGGPTLVR